MNTNSVVNGNTSASLPLNILWGAIGICDVILLGALMWVFWAKQKPEETYKERILVALMFFATSLIIGLLFGVDAKLEFKDAATKFMFVVGGPFAASLIGLFVYYQFVVPISARSPLTQTLANIQVAAQKVTDAASALEKRVHISASALDERVRVASSVLDDRVHGLNANLVGWLTDSCALGQRAGGAIPYADWREATKYRTAATSDFFLRNLLEVAFNPFARHKLSAVKVKSLFVYLNRETVYKFEFVEGTKPSTGEGCAVRLRATGSYPSASVNSISMEANSLTPFQLYRTITDDDDTGALASGFFELHNSHARCLTIARYHETSKEEDYILIANSRFTSEESVHLQCGITWRNCQVQDPHRFEVCGSLVPFKKAIPLIFREVKNMEEIRFAELWNSIRPWIEGLLDHPAELLRNKDTIKNERVMQFWKKAKDELAIVEKGDLGVLGMFDPSRSIAFSGDVHNTTLFIYGLRQ